MLQQPGEVVLFWGDVSHRCPLKTSNVCEPSCTTVPKPNGPGLWVRAMFNAVVGLGSNMLSFVLSENHNWSAQFKVRLFEAYISDKALWCVSHLLNSYVFSFKLSESFQKSLLVRWRRIIKMQFLKTFAFLGCFLGNTVSVTDQYFQVYI